MRTHACSIRTMTQDTQIIALYFARNQEAITQTDLTYGAYCRTIAWNILTSHEDTEECVNDTYLDTWNAIPPTRPDSLKAFLGRLTRNNALNRYIYYTAEKRGGGEIPLCLDELAECVSSADTLSAKQEYAVLVTSINAFLSGIKKEQRVIFVQRYFYECSIREIAQRLKVSENKVKVTLSRLREKLRAHLQKEGIAI